MVDGETMQGERMNWPLMANNITRSDLDAVIDFLKGDIPVLTQASQVRAFEQEWSEWLGVKHSVFVNSGSSANLITIRALKQMYNWQDGDEIIVPALTWSSDIMSVIHANLRPVFVDIDRRTLGMDMSKIGRAVTSKTRAVFVTHALGFAAQYQLPLTHPSLLTGPVLIEDACEATGAIDDTGKKVGTKGLVSNFSFYYAHHLSTIEGGMICTNDERLYDYCRMLRSHGLVRELDDPDMKAQWESASPDLNREFIFSMPAWNLRNTEIAAVIGRNQLKRIGKNIVARSANLRLFLNNLHPRKYQTTFAVDGSSSYALPLVFLEADADLCLRVVNTLRSQGVEFRRGLSGGGNQLRQPYVQQYVGVNCYHDFPNVEHVHFFGFYIGNYSGLDHEKIMRLCEELNRL